MSYMSTHGARGSVSSRETLEPLRPVSESSGRGREKKELGGEVGREGAGIRTRRAG